MARAIAVIGANYGDESKGKFTDYFSNEATTVVRFNGGAQSGHTVVTPEGQRHVFSHVGAGSFRGAKTLLSKYFVINPMVFVKEMDELNKLGVHPRIFADSECLVTTPYDMMFNVEIERSRGLQRHGSCGLGFGATIETRTEVNNSLEMIRHYNRTNMLGQFLEIMESLIVKRLQNYGVSVSDESLDKFKSVVPHYINFVRYLLDTIETDEAPFHKSGNYVFEGGQGLLLDQNSKNFPHVTRSNTGLTNVVKLCRRFGVNELLAFFVSRCYLTRHGNGPMEEDVFERHLELVDKTNVPNEFQGTMKFAPLNFCKLGRRVGGEVEYFKRQINLQHGVAISHIDQFEKVKIYDTIEECRTSLEIGFTNATRPCVYASVGETREDIYSWT